MQDTRQRLSGLTLAQLGTWLISQSMGEVSCRGPFLTCNNKVARVWQLSMHWRARTPSTPHRPAVHEMLCTSCWDGDEGVSSQQA